MAEESPKTEMLRSVKGKDMLLVDNYLYHYDDRTSKAYRWVCSRRKDKVPCRVRMYTSLIDEWDLTRHKVENIIGQHPHGPADQDAIIRARDKKRQADAEGLPCTLGNKSLKRRILKQEIVRKMNEKRKKLNNGEPVTDEEDEEAANNTTSFTGVLKADSSEDEFGDLVESLGIKPPPKPQEKKVLMLKTAKGHHMVAVEGCVYRLDGKSMISSTYRWKCFRSKDLQCIGKIYTECLASGQHRFKPIRLEENTHNHQPYSEEKIEALIRRNNIKILQGKEEQSSFKIFDGLVTTSKKLNNKVEKKTKPHFLPLSATKGGGNVLSISSNIEVSHRPDLRKVKAEATSKLYRQVDDVMDCLENPRDGKITKYTFLPSLKGNRVLIMDNMIFHYDSRGTQNTRAYWTCMYRRDKIHKCNCRLTTEGEGTNLKIVKVSGIHKHLTNHRQHINKRLQQNLKVKDKPLKTEMISMDKDFYENDNNDDDDDDDNDNNNDESTGINQSESYMDMNDFIQMKKPKIEHTEKSEVQIGNESALDENVQSSIVEYKADNEVDPFHETVPVIEYIEMERINSSQYRTDSENELEYKPRATRTRNKARKSNNKEVNDDDEDYVPSTRGRKAQSLLSKNTASTPVTSYNPNNIDITKTTKLRSAKGGELLCVDGYIYHLKSVSHTTRTYWGCIKSKDRILKCPARVTTISNSDNELKVVHLSNSHTHPIIENDIKKRLFNEFSKSVKDVKPKDIMNKSLVELNPEFANLLGEHRVVKTEKFK